MIFTSTKNLNQICKIICLAIKWKEISGGSFFRFFVLATGSLESSTFTIYFSNVLAAPSSSFLKLNFDFATDVSSNLDTTTIVVRDHRGSIVDWCCHLWVSILDSLQIESIACPKALLLAKKNRGFSKVIIKCDSSTIIEACKRSLAPLIIRDIIKDSLEFSQYFRSIIFSSILMNWDLAWWPDANTLTEGWFDGLITDPWLVS